MTPETLIASTAATPVLTFTDADGAHTVDLTGGNTTLGRAPNQNVVLREGFVSRQHASVRNANGTVELVDLGSTHGTFLNGVRVQKAVLHSGDEIQLGSLAAPRLRFGMQSPQAARGASPSPIPDLLTSLTGMQRLQPADGAGEATRGMEQLSFLLRAARQLNAGGALQDILRALLQLTLQLTRAERGFVFLWNGSEMRLSLGLDAHGNKLEEDSTVSRRAMASAVQSEARFSISDTLAAEGIAEWQSVVVNQIRSIYCIPLRKHLADQRSDRLLGLLYLDSQFAAGNLNEVDHQLLDAIAREAAALVQNVLLAEAEIRARKAREELAVASQIHQGLMSIEIPVLPYATISARTVPCLGIGGDFFDAVAVDDWVAVAIADVSGKGVSAAIVAATLQGIIHAQLLGRQGLTEIAALLNQFLCSRKVGKYATCVLLKLFSDGRAEYVSCGHVPPLLVRNKDITNLENGNTVVGLLTHATYASTHLQLQPGDRVLLMTDGVTEAENTSGDAFGSDELLRLAPTDTMHAILSSVAHFQGPVEAQDDCTMVEVTYCGLPLENPN